MNEKMILNRIKLASKILLGRTGAARSAVIYPDDVILTSYPKSGNTWVRFLVGNLISDEIVTFSNIEKIVPDIYQNNQAYLLSIKRPRVLKSHECFCPSYKKVVYIVRNPMDVAVSYYFHQIKFRNIDEMMTINAYIDDFIIGECDAFGSWGENVGSWLGARINKEGFLLVRYEDLLSHPEIELKKIAVFLGLEKTKQELLQSVERSSLENMKLSEKATGKSWKALKNTRADMQFVRNGKSGGWKVHLSMESVNKLKSVWRDLMLKLGYL